MSDTIFTPTPNQPHLPPEGDFTEAELVFMDESPPGLFPENQDSNFGYIIRKLFSDVAQNVADMQDTIYNEHFIATATLTIPQWEIEYGLPPDPPDAVIPLQNQRTAVLARIQRGPFTRTRRNNLIEQYIRTTFGTPIQLVPQGVAIGLGIPIYGEAGTMSSLYMVVENIPGFSYLVWIAATNTPDLNALNRELKRITPAGISFSITNVHP